MLSQNKKLKKAQVVVRKEWKKEGRFKRIFFFEKRVKMTPQNWGLEGGFDGIWGVKGWSKIGLDPKKCHF